MTQGENGEYRRKLIEVTLPLVQISKASRAEKQRSVGTIKNLHKWFAPMPTPALRALIFASLVDDPGPGLERAKLIELVKELVPEDGTLPPEKVLLRARAKISEYNPQLPVVLDPFAGGGTTIVESLRLGLPAVSSDLNPVATLVTRALGDLLPEIAEEEPVSGPTQYRSQGVAFEGFSEDIHYYGGLVKKSVEQKVGHLYQTPRGGKPVAWIWSRTVPCVNPICSLRFPLFGSPWLGKQKGREATVEAVVLGDEVSFVVHQGKDKVAKSTKVPGRAKFSCPKCGTGLGEREIRAAALSGELGLQLMAYCQDTEAGRVFLSPSEVPEVDENIELPEDLDEIELGKNTRDFRASLYGLSLQTDLYTSRQIAVLTAFADEVAEVYDKVLKDGGSQSQAKAIATVLGICVSRMAQSNSMLVRWRTRVGPSKTEPAFGTQAVPILWDFAESYPFGHSRGGWGPQIESVLKVLPSVPVSKGGKVVQGDARRANELVKQNSALIVTDPPYFGQINYADLSDYFYLWLRRALGEVHPDLFGTMATPKKIELVANPVRHGGDSEKARQYFIDGFTEVFSSLQKASRPDLPIIVAYAAKQDEADGDGSVSLAWVALLQAMLDSSLSIVGTMPIESTLATRQVGQGANALASYIILICRPRKTERLVDRSNFLRRLNDELPEAIEDLRKGGVSPLDMGQAAIGPGMKIFSEYKEVLEPDGSPMSVRSALIQIDQAATAVIDKESAEYDAATKFCLAWFGKYAFDAGPYGEADNVLRRTGTTIRNLESGGIVSNKPRGSVRILNFDDLAEDYDPRTDTQISHWEIAMHLAKRFNKSRGSGGVDAAAELVARVKARGDDAINLDRVNRLVHSLFKLSKDRFTETAAKFNLLGTAWDQVMEASQKVVLERYIEQPMDDLFSQSTDEDE